MNSTVLEIKNVKKGFKGNEVLNDVNITVKQGSIYALLGANGAGKSTLLKIVTGLLNSDGGMVTIHDINVADNPMAVQRLFSFSSQNTTVDGVLTGYENLHLIAKLRHEHNPKKVAESLLDKFDLTEAKDKAASTYSGGMRRRLDLAMSLVGNPEFIFLDEPTTGLDPKSRQDLWDTIKEMKSQGKTIFLTTQYLEEADYLADQIGFLREGKIVASGTPDEMKRIAGSDKLLLVFYRNQDADKALKLLESYSPVKKEDCEISIDLTDEITTSLNVLNALITENIELKTFKMITPTLDDVFITLTKGRK
ncbi:ABC transporter ATP-binding protein [Metabacillus sediminilitoris]|uniref:ABC transporter ATP-binding protein n=1 Tax=Metabacillus sediminilitoris TaxID=2567941 RepID=A0A4S4BKC7_9BACI|nr:ABC transporter ATP-binding protein [Metabacillus sediminilitoris]QGQ45814.1 ATP-binding cassette domain-containing protein [Metabacillus sediminilitoris]THF75177.1 ABC transporter ATP-binding protein [Metabacillus sediminilitoris]